MINRRAFVAALFAPFVARFLPKTKEPLIRSIEIRPTINPDWQRMTESLSRRFPGREFYDVAGQKIFPSYAADGTQKYGYWAFLMAADWKKRKHEYPDGSAMPTHPDYVIYA